MTMKKIQLESFDHMVNETAAALVQAAAGSAFNLHQSKQFRRLAGFERLTQTEHDRIFNELVAASLILVMFILEAPDLRVAAEFREYLSDLNKRIPEAHQNFLKVAGVENEHLRDWEKLIAMRYEEYARDKHEVRAAAMQIASADKRLKLHDLSEIQMLVPVQTVAIGCHHHICRGETEDRDDLFKGILNSMSRFYVELRVHLEGGRITPVKRVRVTLKRILRHLRSGRKSQP